MDAKELGNRIQILRKEKGMTQEELAEKTGLSVRTVQRIENGEVDPRSYTLHQIAEALGVDITDLTKITTVEYRKPSDAETKKWLGILHFSGLFVLLLPPLIIWILKRDTYPAMNEQAKDVLNFQISMWLYLFSSVLLVFLGIGIVILPLLGIYSTIMIIVNTIKAANGNPYKYPLSFRFLK